MPERVATPVTMLDGSSSASTECLLASLPLDLLARVAAFLSTVDECGRLECVGRFFHGLPPVLDMSLELRARAAGGLLSPPAGWSYNNGGVEPRRRLWLVYCERRRAAGSCPLALGALHSLTLDAVGGVCSCGRNAHGVLGHGAGPDRLRLTLVVGLFGVRVCSVAAKPRHSLALSDTGSVYTWGRGNYGQLGQGDEQDQHTPKQVEALREVRVVALAAGYAHGMAVTSAGALYTWGMGDGGKLGHGDDHDQHTPKQVEALREVRVVSAAAGMYHSMAVTSSSALYTWGAVIGRRLVHGHSTIEHTPNQVEALREVVTLASGAHHCMVVTSTGALYTWGRGNGGRLGHGDEQDQHTPKQVEALREVRVVALAAGYAHGMAVTSAGALYTWGMGDGGKLGHGDDHDQHTPKQVEALREVRVVSAAAGMYHSMVVTGSGAIYTWGVGTHGALGLGDNVQNQHTPVVLD